MKTYRLVATMLLSLPGFSGVAGATEPAAPVQSDGKRPATTSGDDWVDKAPPPQAAPKQNVPQTSGTDAPAKPQPRPKTLAPDTSVTNQYAPPQGVTTQGEAPATATKDGQWVYTDQYGWIWMPYAQQYTYIAPEGYPYSYSYYPDYGWCWLYSPWVFSWGPSPYWGVYGRAHFAWYSRPWFARPGFYPRGGYGGGFRGGYGGGYRGGYRGGYAGGGFRGGYGGGYHGGYGGGYHGGGFRGGGRGHR